MDVELRRVCISNDATSIWEVCTRITKSKAVSGQKWSVAQEQVVLVNDVVARWREHHAQGAFISLHSHYLAPATRLVCVVRIIKIACKNGWRKWTKYYGKEYRVQPIISLVSYIFAKYGNNLLSWQHVPCIWHILDGILRSWHYPLKIWQQRSSNEF